MGLMVAMAFSVGSPMAVAGAGSFAASDGLIGWRRFLDERPWMPLAIMVTYHLALILLILSLI